MVKIAVIGVGWWSTEHYLPLLKKLPNVDLVAACKLELDELNEIKQKFNIGFCSDNYREILDIYGKELDGVIVSSPHIFHYQHASDAIKKNCHVLVEKPMTVNTEDAFSLYRLSLKHEKQILIPNGFNFTHYMAEAESIIQNQLVGEIKHIDASFSSSLADLFQGIPLSESKDSHFQPKSSTWSDPNKAGGYGWGQLSHMFAAVFKVSRLRAKKVFNFSLYSKSKVDFTNAVSVLFEGGATGSFSGCAFVPKGYGGGFNINIHGNNGVLHVDMEVNRNRLLLRRNNKSDLIYDVKADEGTINYSTDDALKTFIDICSGKKSKNHSDGLVGLETVRFLDALYRSMKTGLVEEC